MRDFPHRKTVWEPQLRHHFSIDIACRFCPN